MANFRTNHSKGGASGLLSKSAVFAVILGGLLYFFNLLGGEDTVEKTPIPGAGKKIEIEFAEEEYVLPTHFFPTSTTNQIIQHQYYALSYSEEHEQAEWVAYELTKESIFIKNVKRSGNFRPDPKVSKGSASAQVDYKGSGYDRGHMVPAGDMAFNKKAMSQTFYMSNMSPQIRNFNGGIWRELEETVRDWAVDNDHLFIVSGPVLSRGIREKIGDNGVSVPDQYYKVILDYTEPELKAIAFLMPNEKSNRPLMDYATSIDAIEKITGLDFFPSIDDVDEEKLESDFDKDIWRIDSKREQQRVKSWNLRK